MRLVPLLLAAGTTTTTFASHIKAAAQKPIVAATPAISNIPLLGFGTWNLRSDGHNASNAVAHAIKTGYRHIDCAAIYGNERDVGRGIAKGLEAAGLQRQDVWVTSKLWNDHHAAAQVARALAATLADLGVEYLDLYLMHWPVGQSGRKNEIKFVETWKAMEALLDTGKVRHIGISNFDPPQLRTLLAAASVRPYAHQMELHAYLPQSAWLQYHREQGIHVTAYSPLGNMNPTYHRDQDVDNDDDDDDDDDQAATKLLPPPLLQHPTLESIAADRGCSPAAVALAWGMTRGTSVIPKSQHAERIEQNFRPCQLEYEDIHALQRLGMKNLTRFNNPSRSWQVPLYQGLEDA